MYRLSTSLVVRWMKILFGMYCLSFVAHYVSFEKLINNTKKQQHRATTTTRTISTLEQSLADYRKERGKPKVVVAKPKQQQDQPQIRKKFQSQKQSAAHEQEERVVNDDKDNWYDEITDMMDRDPSRILGYQEHVYNATFFGFVMRDLANRIMGGVGMPRRRGVIIHPVATMLVVTRGGSQTLLQAQTLSTSTQQQQQQQHHLLLPRDYQYHVGSSFILEGIQRGQTVYALDANDDYNKDTQWQQEETVNDWWKRQKQQQQKNMKQYLMDLSHGNQQQKAQSPMRLDLVLFDPPMGQEDTVVLQANHFLQEAPIRYIVFRVSSTSTSNSNDSAQTRGIKAAETLLQAGYKIQIFSASHSSPTGDPKYGPNTLLSNVQDVQQYLQHGSDLLLQQQHDKKIDHSSLVFHSYLFATRGLDMAIPSRREHLNLTGLENDGTIDVETPGEIPYRPCPAKQLKVSFRRIFDTGEFTLLRLKAHNNNNNNNNQTTTISATCNNDNQTQVLKQIQTKDPNVTHLWFSGPTCHTSEIVCVEKAFLANYSRWSCATRFLPHGLNNHNATIIDIATATQRMMATLKNKALSRQGHAHFTLGNDKNTTTTLPTTANATKDKNHTTIASSITPPQNNILLIELDGVSRPVFQRSFRKTQAFLKNRTDSVYYFPHFSGISAASNSLDNMHALYYGKNENQSSALNSTGSWLWDDLMQSGYSVLKSENGCCPSGSCRRDDSTMESDSDYDLPYGKNFPKLFCLDYERPNCFGGLPTAEYLFDYGVEFIKYHDRSNMMNNNLPWAVFLKLVDGDEETGVLAEMLDLILYKFLLDIQKATGPVGWDDLTIGIVSGSGLNHGNFAQSATGMLEANQPLLILKAPKTEEFDHVLHETLDRNRKFHVTPFDIRKTLQDVIFRPKIKDPKTNSLSNLPGLPLFSELPKSRQNCHDTPEIPNDHCDLVRRLSTDKSLMKELNLMAPLPPSMLSFYADIPITQRNHIKLKQSKQPMPERADVVPGCLCATNARAWFPCDRHPWEELWKEPDPKPSSEFFMLVECPGKPTHLEMRMIPSEALLKRSDQRLPQDRERFLPNILFLELDSVSMAYADRHFPKTRDLLKKFRVRKSAEGYECYHGLCSADFSTYHSLVGANSVPNQVGALSGCVTSVIHEDCGLDVMTENPLGMICNDTNVLHHGLRLQRVRKAAKQLYWCNGNSPLSDDFRTPWLFGLSDSMGYVNFFGEEFCWEGSPYVTQGNVFPKFYQDVESHPAFCRLAEQTIRKRNLTVAPEHRWSFEKQSEPCIEGFDCGVEKARIALSLIESMWKTYSDLPKVAFLNVMGAHVYDFNWAKLFPMAERYDSHLAFFLETMIAREDAKSTIIVVRSDHGLQRGPMAMDYSMQMEHTRPWTEILVPETFPTLSKQALFVNQGRLTNGYDLYRTFRDLIGDHPKGNTAGVPFWAYNLLKTPIPDDRTCRDARVDPYLCREGSIVPKYGVCNQLDNGQKGYCRSPEPLK